MAVTSYIGINRPNVGDPFDKNDPNFDQASNVDVLDEIDARVSERMSALSVSTASLLPPVQQLGSTKTNQKTGYSFLTDGTDVVAVETLQKMSTGATKSINWVSPEEVSGDIIIVGSGGYIMVGYGGTWQEKTSNVTGDLYCVASADAWATPATIAAGDKVAVSSTDGGDTWSDISAGMGLDNSYVYGVDIGGANSDIMAFAAVNHGTNVIDVIYTSDGSTFSTAQGVVSSTSSPYIIWDGEYWVVVAGSVIAISPDLATWTTFDVGLGSGEVLASVGRVGGLYLTSTYDNQFGMLVSGIAMSRYDLLAKGKVSKAISKDYGFFHGNYGGNMMLFTAANGTDVHKSSTIIDQWV